MILGLTEPFRADYYSHGPGDRFGAAVVKYTLVRTALDHGTVDEVHCFVSDARVREWSQIDYPGLSNLNGRFDRYSTRSFHTLRTDIETRDYVFLTHGLNFQPLGQFRLSLPHWRFPISALMHSLNAPTMMGSYVITALFGRSFDSIIATSRAGKTTIERLRDDATDFLERHHGIAVREGPNIVQLPLGVDTAALAPRNRRESRAVLKLPDDRLILLYVGRLTMREKANLSLLVEVFEHVLSRGAPVHLVMAGASPMTPTEAAEVSALVRRTHLAPHVTVIRDFPAFAKSLVLSAADVFVSPVDNIQETFGVAVTEAAAAGLPLVVSDWSGYRDLVVDGETGFLIPTTWPDRVADAISETAPLDEITATRAGLARATAIDREAFVRALDRLLSSGELRARMGQAARDRAVREFSWDVVLPQLRRLWESQIEDVRRAGAVPHPVTQSYSAAFAHFATRRAAAMDTA